MVFNRCAAHGQSVISLEQPHGFSRERTSVLDRLGFIEDAKSERNVFQMRRVASQSAVGCQDNIEIIEVVAWFKASGSSVLEYAQLRSKARGFIFPVEHQ